MVQAWDFLQGKTNAPDRPQLPRRHLAGQMQDRHHARPHPQGRQRRRGLALRHADLRSRRPVDASSASANPPASASAAIPIIGTNFVDAIQLFNEDPDTHAIVMIGEIGGNAEETAAAYINEHVKKPVVGFIAGQTAPPGRRMGHAGAIISGGSGAASDKINAMQAAGITVCSSPAEIGEKIQKPFMTHANVFHHQARRRGRRATPARSSPCSKKRASGSWALRMTQPEPAAGRRLLRGAPRAPVLSRAW